MTNQKKRPLALETLAVHAGSASDPATGARAVPVHQTVSYAFRDTQHAVNLFNLEEAGHIYSRLTNPTVAALSEKIAALEGGVGAACTSSGHAAQLLVLFALLSPGDEFVAAKQLYGGSLNQFANSFPHAFGWHCRFADATDPDKMRKAITDKTKAIFIEGLANPSGLVTDIQAIAKIAEQAGVPLIVDNTLASPYLCRPFDHGAHIVTHSTTKFLSGHGNSMGGVLVDSGKFDWSAQPDRFPSLAKADPGYHGLNFAEMFGPLALTMHAHAVGLRNIGACQQPMNAFLTLAGVETLHLRMQRHSENALKIAQWLESHKDVSWVSYAGLPSSPHHGKVQKYLRDGMAGAVFTFGLKGGYEAGVKLVERVNVFKHMANIGDTQSLIIHPASTTHSQLSDEKKTEAGAAPDVIRLSVGIENADDLIADLEQALE